VVFEPDEKVEAGWSRRTAWHFATVLAVSTAYEALFVYYGLNLLDEAWPLRVAWQLGEGHQLYRDAFWVFPPGHLLPAWIAYRLAPPGVVLARAFYAVFSVLLSAGIYWLARHLMPARFALLTAVCVALAAPNTHLMHAVFGYRYMIFSVLALIAFARRIESDESRWLLCAGLLLGVGALFRLEAPFAAGVGIGVAVAALTPDWRRWWVDWAWLATGILAVLVPLLVWAQTTIGVDVLFREIVTRPATMLLLQSLEFPRFDAPLGWRDRVGIRELFVALQFRLAWLLLVGYAIGLGWSWLRARRLGVPFQHGLLLAVWLWAMVFFTRSTTRSDEPHLDSVIPPVVLLVCHAIWLAARSTLRRLGWAGATWRGTAQVGLCIGALAVWVVLLGTDTWLPLTRRGGNPVASLDGRVEVQANHQAALTDLIIGRLRLAPPAAPILDLTASPMYLLLAKRNSYGTNDIVMPGAFLSGEEELDFLRRVQADPPALVIWSKRPFDNDPSKAVEVTAPRLAAWVLANYERWGWVRRHYLMGPRGAQPPPGWGLEEGSPNP